MDVKLGSLGRVESGDDMLTWNVDARRAAHVIIRYVDAQGDLSVREILPLALEGSVEGKTFNAEYILSHCYLAKASRTFRIDRIRELADAKSGEILDLIEWLGSLPMTGPPQSAEAAPADADAITPEKRAPLRWKLLVLIFVIGYAIGRFRLIRLALHAAGKHWGLWL